MDENMMLSDCINLDFGGRCCAYRQFPCMSNGVVCSFYRVSKDLSFEQEMLVIEQGRDK